MSSGVKTTLPHVGRPQKGNPPVGSDRVKAPVAGAGSTDSGGSQTSLQRVDRLAPNATSDDKKRQELQELVKRHGDLLHELSEFVKGKINVHKPIHSKVASLQSSWRRIVSLGGWTGGDGI